MLTALICRIFGHDWDDRPWQFRLCRRCQKMELPDGVKPRKVKKRRWVWR